MQKLTLVLAIAATAVAVYALAENQSLRTELESRELLGPVDEDAPPKASSDEVLRRLMAVEEDVARVDRVVSANEIEIDTPGLEGRPSMPSLPTPVVADAETEAEAEALLKALVDEAVEKKAAVLETMRNKKPSLDAFAETLELTDEQRAATEREVLRGQREIKALLDTVSDEGTNFMDELVDVLATGIAKPGQAKDQWGKLFARLVSEKVPGTDQTYAERAESVKQSVRVAFRRDMSPAQYSRFEAWQMDPTEVQGIEGSPWEEVMPLVIERAREMGAEIPDDFGK